MVLTLWVFTVAVEAADDPAPVDLEAEEKASRRTPKGKPAGGVFVDVETQSEERAQKESSEDSESSDSSTGGEGVIPSKPKGPANPVNPSRKGFSPTRMSDAVNLPVSLDKSVHIGKIYDFLNDPNKTKHGGNETLRYEFKYFNWGAITEEQKKRRLGQYYIVNWKNKGPAADMELRLDFRQQRTRDRVYTIKIPFPKARGSYKGRFSVTGEQYFKNGQIHSWRISVVRNGTIVAQETSFIW